MPSFTDYDQHDALGLADLVRQGAVSARDLLDEAIRRRDALNPQLNAVVHDMDELAYRAIEAGLPQGPFTGVPFLLKDLLAAYAGVPLTHGSRALRHYVPDRDSEMVRRFKAAGLVIFGKTSCPENGYLGSTESRLHGITRNPWDLQRSAGGSSGGSGAAVAARIVPMASGGDGGGSLRIPASACGLVGLKPSRGRNPYGPLGEVWFGQVQEGVLSRSVRDSAAALDATSGADLGCPYAAAAPPRPFLHEVAHEPGRLRIAYTDAPLLRPGTIAAPCIQALQRCVEQLRALGHELVPAAPPTNPEFLGQAYLLRMMCAAGTDLRHARHVLGRRLRADDFEPATWLLARLGEGISSARLEWVAQGINQQRLLFERFLQGYDAFLTPTLAQPPLAHGAFALQGLDRLAAALAAHLGLGPLARLIDALLPALAQKNFDWVAAPPLANLTGNPSLSLPLQWSDDGLPIGMMFTARYLDEATLLRLAGQLERAYPWAHLRPPLLAQTPPSPPSAAAWTAS